MKLFSGLAAATILFGGLSTATAGIISADFRVDLTLPYSGNAPANANVFENLGATVQADSTELNLSHRIQHDYTGGVGIDLNPGSNALSLFVSETFGSGFADFQRLVVTVSNIVTDASGPINGFALEFDDLTFGDHEDGSPYSISTSFTANSLTVVYDLIDADSDNQWYLRAGGTASFTFTQANGGTISPNPVSAPATVALLGSGLLGVGLIRRRKAA